MSYLWEDGAHPVLHHNDMASKEYWDSSQFALRKKHKYTCFLCQREVTAEYPGPLCPECEKEDVDRCGTELNSGFVPFRLLRMLGRGNIVDLHRYIGQVRRRDPDHAKELEANLKAGKLY